jgi:hypothetical protein
LLREYAQDRRTPSFFDYLFMFFVIGGLMALILGGIALVFYTLNSAGKLWEVF